MYHPPECYGIGPWLQEGAIATLASAILAFAMAQGVMARAAWSAQGVSCGAMGEPGF